MSDKYSDEHEDDEQEDKPKKPILATLTILMCMAASGYSLWIVHNLEDPLIGEQGTQGDSSRIIAGELGQTVDCPQGGWAITTWLDSDGDDILDQGEILDTSELCHGESGVNGIDGINGTTGFDGDDGTSSEIQVAEILPGNSTCNQGGWLLIFMQDSSPVDSIEVCKGSNGQSALVEQLPAPASICADGIQIKFGIDESNDNNLSEEETDSVFSVCSQQLESGRVSNSVTGVGDSFSEACSILTSYNSESIFSSTSSDGCELWKTNGTLAGTSQVLDINSSGDSNPGRYLGFIEHEGALYFDASNETTRQIWVYENGVATQFSNLSFEITPNHYLISYDANLLLFGPNGIYALNSAGEQQIDTRPVKSPAVVLNQIWMDLRDTGEPVSRTFYMDAWDATPLEVSTSDASVGPYDPGESGWLVYDEQVVFKATTSTEGSELWIGNVSDGISRMDDLNSGVGDSRPGMGSGLFRVGDWIVFDAWDGADPDTRLYAIKPGLTADIISHDLLNPGEGVLNKGKLWFSCMNPATGVEVCFSDGTPSGSGVAFDLMTGISGSDPRDFVVMGDHVLIAAKGRIDGDNIGYAIWTVDSFGGVIELGIDAYPGIGDSQAGFYGDILVTDDLVYFIAEDGSNGHELWAWANGEVTKRWLVLG